MIDKLLPPTPDSIGNQSRHTALAGVAMWLALIGAFLATNPGRHFIFFFSRKYRIGAWLGAPVGRPFFYRFIARSSWEKPLAPRSPAGVLRRLFLFSFGVVMAASITVFAPPGWLLAATWMLGEPRTSIPFTLLRVSVYNPAGAAIRVACSRSRTVLRPFVSKDAECSRSAPAKQSS